MPRRRTQSDTPRPAASAGGRSGASLPTLREINSGATSGSTAPGHQSRARSPSAAPSLPGIAEDRSGSRLANTREQATSPTLPLSGREHMSGPRSMPRTRDTGSGPTDKGMVRYLTPTSFRKESSRGRSSAANRRSATHGRARSSRPDASSRTELSDGAGAGASYRGKTPEPGSSTLRARQSSVPKSYESSELSRMPGTGGTAEADLYRERAPSGRVVKVFKYNAFPGYGGAASDAEGLRRIREEQPDLVPESHGTAVVEGREAAVMGFVEGEKMHNKRSDTPTLRRLVPKLKALSKSLRKQRVSWDDTPGNVMQRPDREGSPREFQFIDFAVNESGAPQEEDSLVTTMVTALASRDSTRNKVLREFVPSYNPDDAAPKQRGRRRERETRRSREIESPAFPGPPVERAEGGGEFMRFDSPSPGSAPFMRTDSGAEVMRFDSPSPDTRFAGSSAFADDADTRRYGSSGSGRRVTSDVPARAEPKTRTASRSRRSHKETAKFDGEMAALLQRSTLQRRDATRGLTGKRGESSTRQPTRDTSRRTAMRGKAAAPHSGTERRTRPHVEGMPRSRFPSLAPGSSSRLIASGSGDGSGRSPVERPAPRRPDDRRPEARQYGSRLGENTLAKYLEQMKKNSGNS